MKFKHKDKTCLGFSYALIMCVIDEEYKDFDVVFALTHYLKRLDVIYKYTHSKEARKKMLMAYELREIYGTRKNIAATDFNFEPLQPGSTRLFNN